jgi:hypothetical protein
MAATNSVSTAGNPSTEPFQLTMKQNVAGARLVLRWGRRAEFTM